jgi:hypothetical protein
MSDLAATAERLRVVKRAYEHFLQLWALDRMLAKPNSAHWFRADINRADNEAIADPHNRDWSILYRGSVLDD